jgi:AraC-like DNA-binding protein
MLCALLGPEWKPRRVCFAHDAPADRSVHERVFGHNVEFGHDFNGIVCSRSDLAVPNPNADLGMARYAARMLDDYAGRDAPAMSAQVRDVIVSLLGKAPCTIEVVAQHLGVDRRTIHRRLQVEAKTFSAMVDDVRREFALRYIEGADRPLSEVSSLLGFSAPSSFSRWYRREFATKASEQRAVIARRR